MVGWIDLDGTARLTLFVAAIVIFSRYISIAWRSAFAKSTEHLYKFSKNEISYIYTGNGIWNLAWVQMDVLLSSFSLGHTVSVEQLDWFTFSAVSQDSPKVRSVLLKSIPLYGFNLPIMVDIRNSI